MPLKYELIVAHRSLFIRVYEFEGGPTTKPNVRADTISEVVSIVVFHLLELFT